MNEPISTSEYVTLREHWYFTRYGTWKWTTLGGWERVEPPECPFVLLKPQPNR